MRKPTRLDIEPGVERDERFLREALREARRAGRAGEVPIGCVIVMKDDVVGRGHNRPVTACDPTAHAEIVALRRSARKIGNYRLTGAEVFVTVEPCLMCFGAFVHARVGRVVYGASDPKVGSLRRPQPFRQFGRLNHRFDIQGGVLADDSAALLAEFFAGRRSTERKKKH